MNSASIKHKQSSFQDIFTGWTNNYLSEQVLNDYKYQLILILVGR